MLCRSASHVGKIVDQCSLKGKMRWPGKKWGKKEPVELTTLEHVKNHRIDCRETPFSKIN